MWHSGLSIANKVGGFPYQTTGLGSDNHRVREDEPIKEPRLAFRSQVIEKKLLLLLF